MHLKAICVIVCRAELVFYELADHKDSINHVKHSHLLFLSFFFLQMGLVE